MSSNFRKTALAAGMFSALGGYTMSAYADIQGDAGEANLVPFVLWDDSIVLPGPNPEVLGTSINTVIKVTVPNVVGAKTIPNSYTACHTTPANSTPSCDPLVTAPISANSPPFPGLEPVTSKTRIHWFFMSQNSKHLLNGTIPVSPDDVVVIDWGQVARQNGFNADGVAGYMVLATERASTTPFPAADFAFFAEAWMITGIDGDLWNVLTGAPVTNGAGTIGLVDAKIPVLPMQDGADTVIGGNPTWDNNVVARGNLPSIKASPLHSGMPTIYPDGNPTDTHEFDLTLGNRSIQVGPIANPFQIPTLLVVWNDRNVGQPWLGQVADVFNDDEESCSASIDLPWQLNLIWVQTAVTNGGTFPFPALPVPAFINQPVVAEMDPNVVGLGPQLGGVIVQGYDKQYCVPPVASQGLAGFLKLLEGGFMKISLPEPADGGTFKAEGAMVAFSVPLQYNVNFDASIPVGATLIPIETALSHDRGMFAQ